MAFKEDWQGNAISLGRMLVICVFPECVISHMAYDIKYTVYQSLLSLNWTDKLSPFLWQDNSVTLRDDESCLKHALMKYLDAWSLSPDYWEYNLHVGRLLLLQGRSSEALQHLQTGLALRPMHPALRLGLILGLYIINLSLVAISLRNACIALMLLSSIC